MSDKAYFKGYDKMGRPINYIYVKDQFSIEVTEKLGILSVETSRKLLKGSIETGIVILDMNGFGIVQANILKIQLISDATTFLECNDPTEILQRNGEKLFNLKHKACLIISSVKLES
ncbi:unnamed protein product [Adineta steineri]|uniref:CRAL-TRIO domain-containing protein n=1 Tax=Adineta steineri TaxID=433720 RepID=A0A813V743_9BILA|nr:unnamed protein product [Adineta steineri]